MVRSCEQRGDGRVSSEDFTSQDRLFWHSGRKQGSFQQQGGKCQGRAENNYKAITINLDSQCKLLLPKENPKIRKHHVHRAVKEIKAETGKSEKRVSPHGLIFMLKFTGKRGGPNFTTKGCKLSMHMGVSGKEGRQGRTTPLKKYQRKQGKRKKERSRIGVNRMAKGGTSAPVRTWEKKTRVPPQCGNINSSERGGQVPQDF